MIGNTPKDLINERVRQVTLGYWTSETQDVHIFVPSLTGSPYGLVTLIHEAIHRDLTVGTELGTFETLMGSAVRDNIGSSSEVQRNKRILNMTIKNSWITHESAAVYCSLIQVLTESEIMAYINVLPTSYRTALHRYSHVIGLLGSKGDETVSVLASIARSISLIALSVPILAVFRSYSQVTEERVAKFLKRHNVDARQAKILTQLADKKLVKRLINKGESFLEECAPKLYEATPKDLVYGVSGHMKLMSQLDQFTMTELQAAVPEILSTAPIEQGVQQRLRTCEDWKYELVSRGYGSAKSWYFRSYKTAEDVWAEAEVIALMNSIHIEVPEFESVPFFCFSFCHIRPEETRQHVDAIRRLSGDLWVCVLYNDREEIIELTSTLAVEAGSIAFLTCPTQWHAQDLPPKIVEARKGVSLTGPCIITCQTETVQSIAQTLGSLNTIWVFWQQMKDFKTNTSDVLPKVPGIRLICSARSTAAEIAQECKQLAEDSNLTVFFVASAPKEPKLEEASLFLIAEKREEAVIFIFPVAITHVEFIRKALDGVGHINWSSGKTYPEQSRYYDVIVEALCLFYGVSL